MPSRSAIPSRILPSALLLLAVAAVPSCRPPAAGGDLAGELVVYNAGSLALPVRDLLLAFQATQPGVRTAQESSGSLEAARKLTELGKIPDILAVADVHVISAVLVPDHATWYVGFARNSMVLIHTASSRYADEITTENWHEVLRRPGVRTGRSEPSLDPNGYRTLMVLQLTEAHLGQPGLAERLFEAIPPRWVRPKEADLVALVQAGELDYAWSYYNIARATGLPFVTLAPEVDLSDPERAEWYQQASVRLPGAQRVGTDSVTIRGDPIVYALTIPVRAPNRPLAEAFARFVLSPEGTDILERTGFITMDPVLTGGAEHPPASILPQR